MAEEKVEKKKSTKTKKTKTKSPKKILKSGKDKINQIDLPEDCAALVLTPDGKINVYISEQHENEDGGGTYAQHEELAIALAAMLQNESFVTTTLNTFRNLFEMAVQKSISPENSID
jgi:polyribonucleotide nucleotidyltransferase